MIVPATHGLGRCRGSEFRKQLGCPRGVHGAPRSRRQIVGKMPAHSLLRDATYTDLLLRHRRHSSEQLRTESDHCAALTVNGPLNLSTARDNVVPGMSGQVWTGSGRFVHGHLGPPTSIGNQSLSFRQLISFPGDVLTVG